VSIALSCVGPVGQPTTYAIAAGPAHGRIGSINQATGAITCVSQRGFIGKAYVFTMRSNRQPTWKASCLAPGSSVPGKGC
jgi:hypothetical protein